MAIETNQRTFQLVVAGSVAIVFAQLLVCRGVNNSLGFFNVFPLCWFAGFLVVPAFCVGLLNCPYNWEIGAALSLVNTIVYVGYLRYLLLRPDNQHKAAGVCYLVSLPINLINAFLANLIQL